MKRKTITAIAKVVESTSANELIPEGLDERLSYQHKMFVINYAQHGNGTQAALGAGYSKKTAPVVACRLLKRPNVIQAIQQHTRAVQLASTITKEYVLTELVGLVESIKADPTPNRMMMLRAYETIAKVAGFMTPDTNVNIQNNVDHVTIEIVQNKKQDETTDQGYKSLSG